MADYCVRLTTTKPLNQVTGISGGLSISVSPTLW